jgi:phosphomethylpyrimidine synthase
MTQLEAARKGERTAAAVAAAEREDVAPELVRSEVARGRAVIPANIHHRNLAPIAIGRKFTCKVNANLGVSDLDSCGRSERKKLDLALRLGADTVMDLSTGDDPRAVRREFLERCPVPLGTVPVYEALTRVASPEDLTARLLLDVIEEQAEQGVDYMTVHAGIRLRHLPLARRRLTGIVSRGGAILARWMRHGLRENPLYEHFEDICRIFRKHDVTFSLGDALRPGCLADACDAAQFAELRTLGELVLVARKHGVQVMVEGPGHVPLDRVAENVRKARVWCHDAPFYVLGPLVTDIAPGYDHITSAIGGAAAGWAGAALLCYVTPKEHLGLPGLEDVRQGVVAHKIAAHAADVARGLRQARRRDDDLSRARYAFDWDRQFALALDPETARRRREEDLAPGTTPGAEACTMCGPRFCSMKLAR